MMEHLFADPAQRAYRRPLTAEEIEIVLFAGGGGSDLAIKMVTGRDPAEAVNHDAEALAMHAANFPDSRHHCASVYALDPREVAQGRPVGLLWASPDCKHFSKAKGGTPVSKNIRDLAWVVVHYAELVAPRVIMLENVEEFQGWGPLVEVDDGRGGRVTRPDPARKGEDFRRWVGSLKKLGYAVQWREIRACDYGAPTIRKRLFLIARNDGAAIVWPEPSHGAPTTPEVIAGNLLPHRTAAEILDWSQPCWSIFMTAEEGRAVGVNRPLADATMARIAKGIKRYVLDAKKPFIVPLTHHGDRPVHDIADPLRTVTGAHRGELAVVQPFFAGVGGRAGQSPERPVDKPFHTITAKADTVLVTPHLMTMRNAQKPHSTPDDPLHTITAGGAHIMMVAPVLTYAQQGGGSRAADDPLHTVCASKKDQNCLIAAHVTKFRANSVGSGCDEPLDTITANSYIKKPGGAPPMGVVSAFLAKHYGGVVGASVTDPLPTVTAVDHNSVVSAFLLNQKGSDQRTSDMEAPVPTQTAQGNHVAAVLAFMMKYYGVDQDPKLDEPLHTVTTKDRFALITVEIEGEPYIIADIGMRMLTPRELFRAQGFPDDYIIDPVAPNKQGKLRPLPKDAQIRMCGNSVSPPPARALVAANYQPRRIMAEAAE
jgi:DNA (cytosine-5)-methyltransferase 1